MMRVDRRAPLCLAAVVTSLPLAASRTWQPKHLETSTQ